MTPKKERTRRTADEIVADLQKKIDHVKARQVAKEARQLPEVKALVVATRSLDKAIRTAGDAGRQEMVRALESSRAGLSQQLVELGVRLPDAKARRGRKRKGEAA